MLPDLGSGCITSIAQDSQCRALPFRPFTGNLVFAAKEEPDVAQISRERARSSAKILLTLLWHLNLGDPHVFHLDRLHCSQLSAVTRRWG